MGRKSIPKIITNRQLNFTLSPVDTHNPKKMPYSLQNYEIDGTWNHHQSIILDCILDGVFHGIYNRFKNPPQSWRSMKTIETVDGYSGAFINPEFVSFLDLTPYDAFVEQKGEDVFENYKNDYRQNKEKIHKSGMTNFKQFLKHYYFKDLYEYQELATKILETKKGGYKELSITFNLERFFEKSPTLKRYRYKIPDYLKKISQTKFKMNYKVKYMAKKPTFADNGKPLGRGQLIDLNYQMRDFQQLFSMVMKNKKIILNFNTPLGKLVIHNMLILDTDWLPLGALKLSKNAYFLYKRFVLNKRSGKFKANKISLDFAELKTFLDLKWSNDRGVNALIVKALNDMKENGLIKGFVSDKNYVKRRMYELYFEEKKQESPKEEEEDAKLLKMVAS